MEDATTSGPVLQAAKMRDHHRDGGALVRLARELNEVLRSECEACNRRVPRDEIEGSDPPAYVHWYGGSDGPKSTCAACTNTTPQGVLDDIDTMAEIGYWLFATTPITIPCGTAFSIPSEIKVGALSASAILG